MEYFENAINLVEEKIATLQEKHGSREAIEFNKKQLKTFLYTNKARLQLRGNTAIENIKKWLLFK